MNSISVGSGTNIQDGTIIHVARSNIGNAKPAPTIIGKNVTIGKLDNESVPFECAKQLN